MCATRAAVQKSAAPRRPQEDPSMLVKRLVLPLCLLAAPLSAATAATSAPATAAAAFSVPVEYHKLDNGLRVVLSTDHTAPTVTVGVYYGTGFRVEPRDRTG